MTVRVFQQENTTKLHQHHASDTPSVKREPERAHTTRHTTGCVCALRITWTWLCTRGKKRYKYCSFSHTNRSFRVLGHQCVVTMGNCLIWFSLCMFFFPLIETVTYTCHYMTDRLERFDLKTSKLDLLKKKKDTYILDALGVSWYIPNFNFKVNYPFNSKYDQNRLLLLLYYFIWIIKSLYRRISNVYEECGSIMGASAQSFFFSVERA